MPYLLRVDGDGEAGDSLLQQFLELLSSRLERASLLAVLDDHRLGACPSLSLLGRALRNLLSKNAPKDAVSRGDVIAKGKGSTCCRFFDVPSTALVRGRLS